jgi:antitoxin VapB
MTLSIENEEADRLPGVASTTGESLTDAVAIALQERLERAKRTRSTGVAQRLRRLATEVSDLPVIDLRHPDEIVGYGWWPGAWRG